MSVIKIEPSRYAMQMPRGRGSLSPTHFFTSALNRVSGEICPPAVLFTRGKDPQYPLDKKVDGPQRWSGHRGQTKNPLSLPRIEPHSVSL
jgi:hypothetical protein